MRLVVLHLLAITLLVLGLRHQQDGVIALSFVLMAAAVWLERTASPR